MNAEKKIFNNDLQKNVTFVFKNIDDNVMKFTSEGGKVL